MVGSNAGAILPKAVLDMPHLGILSCLGLNNHAGAARGYSALTGPRRAETGVTVCRWMWGLDTGDMLYKLACPITAGIPVAHCINIEFG